MLGHAHPPCDMHFIPGMQIVQCKLVIRQHMPSCMHACMQRKNALQLALIKRMGHAGGDADVPVLSGQGTGTED